MRLSTQHTSTRAHAHCLRPRFSFHHPPLLVFAAGQFGLLKGRPPAEPGCGEGKLKPPSRTENSVSSQAEQCRRRDASKYAAIEPLAFTQDSALAMNRLREVLANWPGSRIVESTPDYLSVQFETRWFTLSMTRNFCSTRCTRDSLCAPLRASAQGLRSQPCAYEAIPPPRGPALDRLGLQSLRSMSMWPRSA